MRTHGVLLILSAVCGACTSVVDDMLNNQFVTIVPQPTPATLIGNWTGSLGPYLSTLQLSADGTGLHCYSWQKADVIERVKYYEEKIFFQPGQHVETANITADSFALRWPQPGVKDATVIRDPQLKHASPYCARALAEK